MIKNPIINKTTGKIDTSVYNAGGGLDPSLYYTKTEVDENISEAISNIPEPTVDITPTQDSTNLVTSGGVYEAINSIPPTDLSDYYTKDEADSLYALIEHEVIHLLDSVPTQTDLPSGEIGDMRETLDTGIFYIYTPSGWQPTGGLTSLTEYYKKVDADNVFVKKTSDINQIYTTNSTGSQTTLTIGTDVNNIPIRTSGGNITVPTDVNIMTDNAIGAKQASALFLLKNELPQNAVGIYEVTGDIDTTSANGTPICRLEVDNLLFMIVKNNNYGAFRVQALNDETILLNTSTRQYYDTGGVEPRNAKPTVTNATYYEFDDNVGYGGKTNATAEIQTITCSINSDFNGRQYVIYISGASTTNSTNSANRYSLSVLPLESVFIRGNEPISKNDLPSDIVYFDNVDAVPTEDSANLVASGGVYQMIEEKSSYRIISETVNAYGTGSVSPSKASIQYTVFSDTTTKLFGYRLSGVGGDIEVFRPTVTYMLNGITPEMLEQLKETFGFDNIDYNFTSYDFELTNEEYDSNLSQIIVFSTIDGMTNPLEISANSYYTLTPNWSYSKKQIDDKISNIDISDMISVDNTPTENSTNLVSSGGVYDAISVNDERLTALENTVDTHVSTDYIFDTVQERDDYFNSHPTELKDGVYSIVPPNTYQYTNGMWNDVMLILKGEKGDKGDKGDKGEQGIPAGNVYFNYTQIGSALAYPWSSSYDDGSVQTIGTLTPSEDCFISINSDWRVYNASGDTQVLIQLVTTSGGYLMCEYSLDIKAGTQNTHLDFAWLTPLVKANTSYTLRVTCLPAITLSVDTPGRVNVRYFRPTFETNSLTTTVSNIGNRVTNLENGKQDKLTAGTNITIENNVISAAGSSYTFDINPTENSTNPVTSDGIYKAIKNVSDSSVTIKEDGSIATETGGKLQIGEYDVAEVVSGTDSLTPLPMVNMGDDLSGMAINFNGLSKQILFSPDTITTGAVMISFYNGAFFLFNNFNYVNNNGIVLQYHDGSDSDVIDIYKNGVWNIDKLVLPEGSTIALIMVVGNGDTEQLTTIDDIDTYLTSDSWKFSDCLVGYDVAGRMHIGDNDIPIKLLVPNGVRPLVRQTDGTEFTMAYTADIPFVDTQAMSYVSGITAQEIVESVDSEFSKIEENKSDIYVKEATTTTKAMSYLEPGDDLSGSPVTLPTDSPTYPGAYYHGITFTNGTYWGYGVTGWGHFQDENTPLYSATVSNNWNTEPYIFPEGTIVANVLSDVFTWIAYSGTIVQLTTPEEKYDCEALYRVDLEDEAEFEDHRRTDIVRWNNTYASELRTYQLEAKVEGKKVSDSPQNLTITDKTVEFTCNDDLGGMLQYVIENENGIFGGVTLNGEIQPETANGLPDGVPITAYLKLNYNDHLIIYQCTSAIYTPFIENPDSDFVTQTELDVNVVEPFDVHRSTDITRWENSYKTERRTMVQNLYSMGGKEDTSSTHTITTPTYNVTDENGGIIDITTTNLNGQFVSVSINNVVVYDTDGIIDNIPLRKSFQVNNGDVFELTASDISMINEASITPAVVDTNNPITVLRNTMSQQIFTLQQQVLSINAARSNKHLDTTQTIDIETLSQSSGGWTVPSNNGLGGQIVYEGIDFLLGSSGWVDVNGDRVYDYGGLLGLKIGTAKEAKDVMDGDLIETGGLNSIFYTPYVEGQV